MAAEKILLIEDDLFLHDLYRDTLVNGGYLVVSARDGEAGLKLIRENTDASLVLLDLMLPKMNGIDVLKTVKQDEATKGLSIIVLTNLSEEDIIREALRLGASAYLVKVDYTPQEVIEMVRQYIELRSHIRKSSG